MLNGGRGVIGVVGVGGSEALGVAGAAAPLPRFRLARPPSLAFFAFGGGLFAGVGVGG